MKIDSVIARQRVDDLEAAIPFYERLTGQQAARFAYAGVQLAGVGPFLLISGPDEAVQQAARVNATVATADLTAVIEEAVAAGATMVMPPQPTPNGLRAILRHPHGGVYEYVGP
ncbi:VOC family protein [Streptomyces sp. A7024]|uniref:VOC family protein n=2 Tax=Streptomyces coryli TaxID=1128680 RepID=A0A6G4TSP1_9ACTN|nr:VOC family protein [Streptomyces coryli]NGN62560.1 VOC family protein [Streptomyces coryli]